MDGMAHAALSYLRDGQSISPPTLIDITSLLQVICNDFSDMGSQVTFEGTERVLIRAYSSELRRAVTNLVDNALKYGGGRAVIRLQANNEAGSVVLEVVDSGPGIPAGLKDVMLVPFARGDVVHNPQAAPTGFGLGLAIAQSAAKLHDGELLLLDAQPHGLIARLVLPMRPDNLGADRERPEGLRTSAS
jgi:signal transduction histidine kinase